MWQLNKFILRACTLVLLVAGMSMPGFAANRAIVDMYGYSPDGRYFAFEEFGIQDGSGVAYTSIYMIDLVENRWVTDTPIHLRADDEETLLISLRRKALAMAMPRLEELEINHPSEALAFVGAGAVDTDGFSLAFGLPPISELDVPDERFELKLSEFQTKGATPCRNWTNDEPTGFSLQLTINGEMGEVYSDGGVLAPSRGCPIAYRIKAVVIPFEDRDLTHAVAIISQLALGFEGPDRRFLAVPIGRKIKP